jgi:hypothetical protein
VRVKPADGNTSEGNAARYRPAFRAASTFVTVTLLPQLSQLSRLFSTSYSLNVQSNPIMESELPDEVRQLIFRHAIGSSLLALPTQLAAHHHGRMRLVQRVQRVVAAYASEGYPGWLIGEAISLRRCVLSLFFSFL